VLESRADDLEGSGATESYPEMTTADEEYGLIMGNLSLCGNVADNVFLPFVGDCNKYYLCRCEYYIPRS